jgi:hypothetical protein
MVGPVVERRRVEVGSGRPDESMDLWIDLHRGEESAIPERAVHLTFEDGLQVNLPGAAIIETDPKPIIAEKLDGSHAIDRVVHGSLVIAEGQFYLAAGLAANTPSSSEGRLARKRASSWR